MHMSLFEQKLSGLFCYFDMGLEVNLSDIMDLDCLLNCETKIFYNTLTFAFGFWHK